MLKVLQKYDERNKDMYKDFIIHIKNSTFINSNGLVFSENSRVIFDNCKFF